MSQTTKLDPGVANVGDVSSDGSRTVTRTFAANANDATHVNTDPKAGRIELTAPDGHRYTVAPAQTIQTKTPVAIDPIGLGGLQNVPASTSANGFALAAAPGNAIGIRFYIGQGAFVQYALASTQPGAPPTTTVASNSSTGQIPLVYDENLSGLNVYVTNASGSVQYRYV